MTQVAAFVLIILVSSHRDGVDIESVYFNTEDACEKAEEIFNYTGQPKLEAVCFPTGN